MTRRWPCVVVSMLLYLLVAPSVSLAATSGNEWKGLSEPTRLAYVGGVLDGWQAMHAALPAGNDGAYVERFGRLPACAVRKGMTRQQTLAIVDKYMTDHPGEWHVPMPFLIWSAMNAVCE